MTMNILEQTDIVNFPFEWADTESYRNSDSNRIEIYLPDDDNSVDGLMSLFYTLFGKLRHNLLIYDKLWWDFCLDTWNHDSNEYNYDFKNKLGESRDYLKMLKESGIEVGFTGCCKCKDWDKFLTLDSRFYLKY